MQRLRTIVFSLLALAAFVVSAAYAPGTAEAAASMSVSAPASVTVGDNVTITVNITTSQSANAFDATFTYPSGLFDGVRGTYSGSVCTLPIVTPDPSGGSATISCGRPSGFTGSGVVATIVLKATAAGSGSFGLSGCTVLANDGAGTDITGGCSGRSVTVGVAATPTPTAAHTATPTPTAKGTAKPTPTPTPGGTTKPADTAQTPTPTPVISAPAAVALPSTTPTPEAGASADTSAAPKAEQRSIGQAFSDILGSLKDFKVLGSNTTGVTALMATSLPFLALVFGILLISYRLYMLERRRRRTLDRLFELELAELASLEGKLDLLSEKGGKGPEKFKAEFETAKENILRQIHPDYGKSAKDAPAKEKPADKPEKK